MTIDELYDKTEKLREYAEIDNSELGELSIKLCELVSGLLDYSSQTFQDTLAQEISEQLEWFQTNTRIVTTEREVVLSPITELEYIND